MSVSWVGFALASTFCFVHSAPVYMYNIAQSTLAQAYAHRSAAARTTVCAVANYSNAVSHESNTLRHNGGELHHTRHVVVCQCELLKTYCASRQYSSVALLTTGAIRSTACVRYINTK